MKLQELNRILVSALMISGALGVASQAHALALSPGMETWTSISLSNLGKIDVEGIVGVSPLGLVYKQDQGGLFTESGNGAGYYTTTFTYESAGDASGATITWDGGLKISCGSCFLVVKDGNHSSTNPPPYPQYIFNLSNTSGNPNAWNGTDTITLSGFWPGPGSISNVAIWNIAEGDGSNPGGSLVPEPETYGMLLAGLGLVGFAARRKLGNPV
jgi:hypothetical protein